MFDDEGDINILMDSPTKDELGEHIEHTSMFIN